MLTIALTIARLIALAGFVRAVVVYIRSKRGRRKKHGDKPCASSTASAALALGITGAVLRASLNEQNTIFTDTTKGGRTAQCRNEINLLRAPSNNLPTPTV